MSRILPQGFCQPFAFLAPVAYRGYPLDRERHRSILAALAAPRAEFKD